MSEWKEYKLGELIQSVSETYKFKPREKVVFLNTSDILDGKFLTDSLSEASTLPGQAKKKIQKGDILFSEIRPANKRFALVDFDCDNYVVSTKLMVLRCNDNVDNRFIYNYLTSKEVLEYLQMVAEDRSGTFPQITFDIIANMDIELLTIEEQRRIASILTSLDDKIDLLRRENATLEAMAETLFRQWFVEEAKEEWEEKPLKEVVDIAIGRTPPRKESKWFSTNPNDIKWLSIKDMGGDSVFLFNTSEYLTKEAVEVFSIPIIPKSTVVLSFKMTVGRVGITTEDMLSNEAIAHFKFMDNTPFSKEYLYLFLKSFRYDTLGSTSSIVTAINSAMIKNMEIPIPDTDTMERYRNQTQPMFDKIYSNQEQINILIQTRDGLLPRMMNNEIKL